MITILVADDHTMFREGLRNLLEAEVDMRVVGEAATAEEVREMVKSIRPDVVLLDVAMPGRGSVETVRALKRSSRAVRILMLTARPEDHHAISCLRSGADGYLTKDKASQQLIDAIRDVRRGKKYISTRLAEKLASTPPTPVSSQLHEGLSNREFEVMRLIATGRTVSEIAELLGLSVKTVSTYRSRILQKMNLRNNAEIMQYAIQEGLIDSIGEC